MEKNRKKQIVVLSIALVCIFILVFSLFHKSATKDSANPPLTNVLTDSISQIVSACPGEIGVAVIVNNRDTVKVNNKSVYPMYLQPIITQYFIDNKSEIWLLFLIAHSKR